MRCRSPSRRSATSAAPTATRRRATSAAPPKSMPLETALAAVDLLLGERQPGERVNLAFLGGEPLVNRAVLRAATEHAAARSRAARRRRRLLDHHQRHAADAGRRRDFFEQHGFAVTVSLDGVGATHDALRPFKGGPRQLRSRSSRSVAPLLARQRRMQVSARVTVTPRNLACARRSTTSSRSGSTASASRRCCASPPARGEMAGERPGATMLEQMIDCGASSSSRAPAGGAIPSPTWSTRCARSTAARTGRIRAAPARGYLGVSADGELVACHRFVGDEAGAMGTLAERRRPRAPGALAGRAPRASPGACRELLGALSLRRRLPSRGDRIAAGRPATTSAAGCTTASGPTAPRPVRTIADEGIVDGWPSHSPRRKSNAGHMECEKCGLASASWAAVRRAALRHPHGQLGHQVALVESVRFPRPHLGESLSPGVLPLLGEASAPRTPSVDARVVCAR